MQLLEGFNTFPMCLNNEHCLLIEFSILHLNLLLVTLKIVQSNIFVIDMIQ